MAKSNDLRYTCKRCGRRTGNYSECVYGRGENKVGESYCDECIDELLARVDWENESFRESSITCSILLLFLIDTKSLRHVLDVSPGCVLC